MSKRTDVTYGRRGGRLVPTDDMRPLLEQIDELRQRAGGSFTPEPAPAEDGQLEAVRGRRVRRLTLFMAMFGDEIVRETFGWPPALLLVLWQVAYFRMERAAALSMETVRLYESSLRHPANGTLSAQLDALEALWEKENRRTDGRD